MKHTYLLVFSIKLAKSICGNICSIKFGSKLISNTVLCLQRNLMEQSLLESDWEKILS